MYRVLTPDIHHGPPRSVWYARSGDELPLPCSAGTHTSGCASCMPAGVQSSSHHELLESWWLLQPLLQPLALAQRVGCPHRDHPALSNTAPGAPCRCCCYLRQACAGDPHRVRASPGRPARPDCKFVQCDICSPGACSCYVLPVRAAAPYGHTCRPNVGRRVPRGSCASACILASLVCLPSAWVERLPSGGGGGGARSVLQLGWRQASDEHDEQQ